MDALVSASRFNLADLSWQFESPPAGMALIPQGTFVHGSGVNKGEEFTDSDNDGEFDSWEPFEISTVTVNMMVNRATDTSIRSMP